MKIKATITDGKDQWNEEFEDRNILDPKKYMDEMLEGFNDGCRPGELHRRLISVVVLSESGLGTHDWEKTNLVTIRGRTGTYDTARCRKCGVTGRRYGLGNAPLRDRKYLANKYKDCNWMENRP